MKLLTMPDANPKLAKGLKRGVMSFALHLAPADLSGREVCPKRTAGCSAACLNTAGRGRFDNVQNARIARTEFYFANRLAFMQQLVSEVSRAIVYAEKRGYDAAFRLNATSDIPWHRVPVDGFDCIMDRFPTVQFYDYTKVAKRLISETLPANYHLTFSLAENNDKDALRVLTAGHSVAAVYRTRAMVESDLARGYSLITLDGKTRGVPIADGDETDLRFLDPRGVIVALYAKGRAKLDQSGFVRDC